jgi:hypothetical protein
MEEMIMAQPYLFLEDLDLKPDVKFRLSQSLDRIERGNDEIYTSPMAIRVDPVDFLAGWDEIFERRQSELDEELVDLELHNRKAYGPRSLSKPWSERKASVESYFEEETLRAGPEVTYPTSHSLRPLSVGQAAKFLKSNTSSGLPDLKRKGLVVERTERELNSLLDREDPCVLFTRTQDFLSSENRSKTRNVWGYPVALTLLEMQVYRVLLEYAKKLPFRAALLGPDHVDRAVSQLFGASKLTGGTLVSIDFDSYDASVKEVLQNSVRQYIKGVFQTSTDVVQKIDYIFDRFNDIGIVTPDGVMLGPHGIPSGSTFTNEADSLAQHLVVQDLNLPSQIQGDDGLYLTHEPDELYSRFKEFNLEANVGKSYQSNDFAVYLQRYYSTTYVEDGVTVGIMPTYRVINRLMYPERYTDFEEYGMVGSDYFAIRSIALLENCKYHPFFEDLVKYAVRNDKYGLTFTGKGLKKYVKMLTETSGIQGLIKNQFGDDVRGILNFETIKVIKSL